MIHTNLEFARGIVAHNGGDPALLGQSGTTAVADSSRAGTRRVACYQIGGHTLLPCDPDILRTVEALNSGETSLSDADFRTWVSQSSGSVLGEAIMKVLGDAGLMPIAPVGMVRHLDWSKQADVALMQAFVDSCDADDLDEAEVDMDDLDDRAVALLDDGGVIVAYASARPFDDELPFGDIGIVTAGGRRRGGWGRAAVSVLIRDVLEPAGIDPLYRCDPANSGSDRVSAALGFEVVATLSVAELPEA